MFIQILWEVDSKMEWDVQKTYQAQYLRERKRREPMEVGQSLEDHKGLAPMKEKGKGEGLARENLRLYHSSKKISIWQPWGPPAEVTIRSATSHRSAACISTLLSQVIAWSSQRQKLSVVLPSPEAVWPVQEHRRGSEHSHCNQSYSHIRRSEQHVLWPLFLGHWKEYWFQIKKSYLWLPNASLT